MGKSKLDGMQQSFQDNVKGASIFATASGSANSYTATLSHTPAYFDGLTIRVAINVDASGASTLNVNGLGAIPIKKANGNDVTNLKQNGVYTFVYSGGNFILQGEGGEGTATSSQVLSGETFTNDEGVQVGSMIDRNSASSISNIGNYVNANSLNLVAPDGYYDGGTSISITDSDFVHSNIKSGVNLFGVDGSLVEGLPFSSGSAVSPTDAKDFQGREGDGTWRNHSLYYIQVDESFGFIPRVIIVWESTSSAISKTIYMDKTYYPRSDGRDSNDIWKVEDSSQSNSNLYGNAYDTSLSMTDGYVNSTGFVLPVNNPNYSHKWIAIGS